MSAPQTPQPTIAGFVNTFLVVNRELDAGSARTAYHQARRVGFSPIEAVGIEARVSAEAKAQAKELKIRRDEWLADYQMAGVR